MANEAEKGNQKEYDPKEYHLPEDDVAYGVMNDKLDNLSITRWALLGIVILVILIAGSYFMYEYNKFVTTERLTTGVSHQEVEQMKEQAHQRLNSFGMLDEEEGTYHIPIDSAITLYINEKQ